jgi:hypothetical protein
MPRWACRNSRSVGRTPSRPRTGLWEVKDEVLGGLPIALPIQHKDLTGVTLEKAELPNAENKKG